MIQGIPIVMFFLAAVTTVPWLILYALCIRRGQAHAYHAMSLTITGIVTMACLATVGGRTPVPLAMLTALGFAAALLMLIIFVITASVRPIDTREPGTALFIVTMFMATTGVISLMANGYSIVTYINPIVSLWILPASVYLAQTSNASTEQLLTLTYRNATGIVYVSLLLAIVAPQLAFGDSNQDVRRIPIAGLTKRLSGVAGHPNFLAFIALIMFVIAVGMRRKFWRVNVLISVSTIGLAEARDAIIALILVAFFLFISNGRKALRATLSAPFVVVFILMAMHWESSSGSALTADVSTNGRFRVWKIVLENFHLRPILGWGPAAFRESAQTPLLQAGLAHAHNEVLESIAEGGIIGLVLLAAFSCVILWNALSNWTQPVHFGLVIILFVSFMTQIFLNPQLWGANIGAVPTLLLMPAFVSVGRSPASLVQLSDSMRSKEIKNRKHPQPAT